VAIARHLFTRLALIGDAGGKPSLLSDEAIATESPLPRIIDGARCKIIQINAIICLLTKLFSTPIIVLD
jgi:hypothetical protein